MEKDLMEELRELIRWLQDYERFGGLMTPPMAFRILCALENAQSRLLDMQTEIDIQTTKARCLELGRKNRI